MTSIACVGDPTSSVTSARTVWAASSARPCTSDVLKPSLVTRTVYMPACRLGALYSPASLVVTGRDTFVGWLTTVTLALGTVAPELSWTTPVIVPRSDWPNSDPAGTIKRRAATETRATTDSFMDIPPLNGRNVPAGQCELNYHLFDPDATMLRAGSSGMLRAGARIGAARLVPKRG